LRGSNPPVVARIDEDRLLIDLRTVHPREEHALAAALRAALSATSPG
jgi:ribosomal protein L16/L10AE